MLLENPQRSKRDEPEVLIAAGLLAADGSLEATIEIETATDRLRQLLSPAALWKVVRLEPDELRMKAWQRLGAVPRWEAPQLARTAALTSTLREAWRRALPPPVPQWGRDVLRLQAASDADAQLLQRVGQVGPYLLVPMCPGRHPHFFSWRWPLRIAVAPGPYADSMLQQLADCSYRWLFDAELARSVEEEHDLLLVGPGTADAEWKATCAVYIDPAREAQSLLSLARSSIRGALIIGVQSDGIGWFDALLRELAHDQPIDVALRIAVPEALIAGDANFCAWTAPRQWALEMLEGQRGTDLPPQGLEDRLANTMLHGDFGSELGGTSELIATTRSVENTGRPFALSRGFATAARQAPAPPRGDRPSAEPRFVKAQAVVPGEDAPRLKTFKPKSKHRLAIWIDVARDTDANALVAGAPFDDSGLPPGDVELVVHVDCDALAVHASKPISLSTVDRTTASTSAVFEFESGDEDQLLTIRVLVTYRGRPMQELSIVGAVRAEAVGADQIRFTNIPLSAPPEPHEETTQGEAILVVNGANLERAGSERKVDLSQVRPIIEKINKDASTVLAGSEVPEALDDPQALKLLVKLARAGSGLKDVLAPLELPEEGTLSLLIDMTTELLPLELVYDAEKPDKEAAVLCEHKPGGKRVGEPTMCPEAGAGIVCPMAFWGQRRSIVRTIRFPANHKSGRYDSLRPIELRPLLYAAAAKADKGVKEKPLPTAFLAQQLQQLLGKDNVLFASNWTEWVDLIKRHPQLLLVLGHTESSDGDTVLEIGEKSWLTDVREAVLHVEGAPPPLVLLLACSTAVPRNPFGGLPAAFTAAGAAAVVATLTKMQGPHGARAAAQVVKALWEASASGDKTLGGALTSARRQLVQDGILDGLLLVSHGEIDMALRTT